MLKIAQVTQRYRAIFYTPNYTSLSILLNPSLNPHFIKRQYTNSERRDKYMISMNMNDFIHSRKYDEVYPYFISQVNKGLTPDLYNLNTVVRGLVKCDLKKAEEFIFSEMKEKYNTSPNSLSFHFLIEELIYHQDLERAYQVYQEMKNMSVQPKDETYLSLILGFYEMKNLNRSNQIREELVASQIPLDTKLFENSIQKLCKMRKVELAEYLLKIMEEMQIPPNVEIFTALINEFLRENEIDKSRDLLYLMNEKYNLKPSDITMSIILKHVCKNNDMDNAMKLLKMMESRDLITYYIIIRAYCRLGNLDAAMKLYNEMKEEGITPDKYLYSTLMNTLLKKNKIDQIDQVLKDMKENSVPMDAHFYSLLIRYYVGQRNIQNAMTILRSAEPFELDCVCYTPLILHFVKTNEYEKAKELFEEMEKKNIKLDKYIMDLKERVFG